MLNRRSRRDENFLQITLLAYIFIARLLPSSRLVGNWLVRARVIARAYAHFNPRSHRATYTHTHTHTHTHRKGGEGRGCPLRCHGFCIQKFNSIAICISAALHLRTIYWQGKMHWQLYHVHVDASFFLFFVFFLARWKRAYEMRFFFFRYFE